MAKRRDLASGKRASYRAGGLWRPLRLLGLAVLVGSAAGPARAATFTVTNNADNGAGSLRQAITDANATVGADSIVFAPGLTSPIVLTSGQLTVSDTTGALDILGPGASVLTVSGNNTSRVFLIDSGVTATISGLTIANGAAGGVFNFGGTLTISSCLVSGNTASQGGGLANVLPGASLTLINSTVSGNTATSFGGGGIFNFSGATLTILNSTLSDNTTPNANYGGGLLNNGTATITGSTLSGNVAGPQGGVGGGIANNGGTLTLLNCTLSGNSGEEYAGGLFNSFLATATISFTTLTGNSAGRGGGGIMNVDSTAAVTLKSSIVANSTGGDCFNSAGTFSALGNNLDTDGSCAALAGFSTVTAAALNLGPLAGNGGPTRTHALVAPSAATDAASDCDDALGSPVSSDQRGAPRPGGAQCDIGAFEGVGSGVSIPALAPWSRLLLGAALAAAAVFALRRAAAS